MIKDLSELESITFAKRGMYNIVKSASVWGNKGCTTFPLFYIRKPKWISQQMFDELMANTDIIIKVKDKQG